MGKHVYQACQNQWMHVLDLLTSDTVNKSWWFSAKSGKFAKSVQICDDQTFSFLLSGQYLIYRLKSWNIRNTPVKPDFIESVNYFPTGLAKTDFYSVLSFLQTLPERSCWREPRARWIAKKVYTGQQLSSKVKRKEKFRSCYVSTVIAPARLHTFSSSVLCAQSYHFSPPPALSSLWVVLGFVFRAYLLCWAVCESLWC